MSETEAPPPPDQNAVLSACMAAMNDGRLDQAEARLAPLLQAAPGHPGALYLSGMIAFGRQDWGGAANALHRALQGAPGQPRIALPLSQALQALGRVADAQAVLRQALALPAADAGLTAQLEHQLGLALKRQQQPDAAIIQMNSAAKRAPSDRQQSLERASLLRQLQRHDEALTVYDGLLQENPLDLDTHLLLNELQLSLGNTDGLLSSYDNALGRVPGAAQLPRAKGRLLLKLARPEEARLAFDAALRLSPGDPGALAGLSRALEWIGDLAGAQSAHAASIADKPDGDALEAYAAFLLRSQELPKALAMAEAAVRLRPESQGALALLGLCLRRTGDARAEWLNDYQRHIRVFDLDPPDGYAEMGAFNRGLADCLARMHDAGRQYLTQSLRGGTQTHDEIFYNGHDLVDHLLPRITGAVRRYILEMADDPTHPLSSRRSQGFRYAGSWSSQLDSQGFHANHIHQKGWISSCYYVAVPGAVADANSQQGWLKFGEPSEEFGTAFTPCRTIQPVPGRLVLFPSYMWHGTIAFRDPHKRVTIAFDAIPA